MASIPVTIAALGLGLLPRFIEALRFRQSLGSLALHPFGVAVFLTIQWIALGRKLLGLQTTWRGRSLSPQ